MPKRRWCIQPWSDDDSEALCESTPSFRTRRAALRFAKKRWRHGVVYRSDDPSDLTEVSW